MTQDKGGEQPAPTELKAEPAAVDASVNSSYRSIIGSLQRLGYIEDTSSRNDEVFGVTRKYHDEADSELARQNPLRIPWPWRNGAVRLGFQTEAGRKMFEIEWVDMGRKTRIKLVPTDRGVSLTSEGRAVYEIEESEAGDRKSYRRYEAGMISESPEAKGTPITQSTWEGDRRLFSTVTSSLQETARKPLKV